jgi:hypothetical protein
MLTIQEIESHPLKRWQDVDALIAHAEHNGSDGSGYVITERIWQELVRLHQRIEELGGYGA